MTLYIEDKWVWDFWFAKQGADIHIFYLQAPKAIGNPDLRHWHSTIGHAVSMDLSNWEILPDALHPSDDETAWDSFTTWTGCTLKHEGTYYMFYTGTSRKDKGLIQRIGLATSKDLVHWEKYGRNPLIKFDPERYESLDRTIWYEQAWRDPWVFEYDGKFHAFITARSRQGKPKERGVIGYAHSHDLSHWQVEDPMTPPGEFAYLEVPQLVHIDQRWFLIFCVEGDRYSDARFARKGGKGNTGTHYMLADSPFGPFEVPKNDLLFGDRAGSYYSGKLIQDKQGRWMFLTAIQKDSSSRYSGIISNPMPVFVDENGELRVIDEKDLG
jgi:beta-fructofuranosidase